MKIQNGGLMVIKNPCKTCLVKPCCNNWCKNRHSFQHFSEKIIPAICFGFSLISVFSFVMFIINIFSTLYIIITFGSIWSISVLIVPIILKFDYVELDISEFLSLIILNPIFVLAILLIHLYEYYSEIKIFNY